jgi:hypothetical protein
LRAMASSPKVETPWSGARQGVSAKKYESYRSLSVALVASCSANFATGTLLLLLKQESTLTTSLHFAQRSLEVEK